MKTLKLVFSKEGINFVQPRDEGEGEMPIQQVTYNIIRNIIMTYAQEKRGLQEEERRLYYKICDAFEKLLKNKGNGKMPEEIKLEDNWMGFIRKCKKEVRMNPDMALQRVEELIDSVENR